MNGYSVEIKETSKELAAKERIALKDLGLAIKLDEATKEAPIVIPFDSYAVLAIHNEKSDSKDYSNYVIIAKDGTKYVTGSESFFSSFMNIYDEMLDENDTNFEIVAYRLPSKNYKGKDFLTCSIQ